MRKDNAETTRKNISAQRNQWGSLKTLDWIEGNLDSDRGDILMLQDILKINSHNSYNATSNESYRNNLRAKLGRKNSEKPVFHGGIKNAKKFHQSDVQHGALDELRKRFERSLQGKDDSAADGFKIS